jgi:hypothetical protein
MTEEKKDEKENPVIEKLEAAGQVIIGELEKIGGIITADRLTQAEGDFNIEAGLTHARAATALETEETKGPEKD